MRRDNAEDKYLENFRVIKRHLTMGMPLFKLQNIKKTLLIL